MTTAQIIYEQYKVLPKRVRQEVKKLIIEEEEADKSMSLMEEIEGSLKQVKAMRDGKMPKRDVSVLFDEE